MKSFCILLALGFAVAVGCVSQTRAQNKPPQNNNIVQAFTLPYKPYPLHFKAMGRVGSVKVKEGDVVKAGDLLMALDSTEEKAEQAILELDAVNENNIKAAVAEHELAVVRFKKEDDLYKKGQQNEMKMLEAKAQMDVAFIKIDQARQEKKVAELKRDRQAKHIELMELRAPTDGIVQQLHNDLGATIDPTKPSLTIVQNNPLKVEVQVPGLASLQLKAGDKMRVSHDQKTWKDASVSFVSPVADAASGMRMVYLDLPNADQEPSGLQVFVELPEKLLAAR